MSGLIDFEVELEGDARLERAFDEAARSISDGLRHAVAEGLKAGADEARRNHPYQDQSGDLTRSIRDRMEITTPGGAVGVIEAKAKYAKFVEKGTKPHVIAPKNAKLLHWVDGGQHFFSKRVEHPGTTARPFIKPAGAFAERHIERSIELDILLNLERILGDF